MSLPDWPTFILLLPFLLLLTLPLRCKINNTVTWRTVEERTDYRWNGIPHWLPEIATALHLPLECRRKQQEPDILVLSAKTDKKFAWSTEGSPVAGWGQRSEYWIEESQKVHKNKLERRSGSKESCCCWHRRRESLILSNSSKQVQRTWN